MFRLCWLSLLVKISSVLVVCLYRQEYVLPLLVVIIGQNIFCHSWLSLLVRICSVTLQISCWWLGRWWGPNPTFFLKYPAVQSTYPPPIVALWLLQDFLNLYDMEITMSTFLFVGVVSKRQLWNVWLFKSSPVHIVREWQVTSQEVQLIHMRLKLFMQKERRNVRNSWWWAKRVYLCFSLLNSLAADLYHQPISPIRGL